MWKNKVFLLAVLYWTVDGTALDSGQWTVDSGQWTVDSGQKHCPVWDNRTLDGPSCTGQTQPGAAGQWTSGQWTVDGTEWTEALSLL